MTMKFASSISPSVPTMLVPGQTYPNFACGGLFAEVPGISLKYFSLYDFCFLGALFACGFYRSHSRRGGGWWWDGTRAVRVNRVALIVGLHLLQAEVNVNVPGICGLRHRRICRWRVERHFINKKQLLILLMYKWHISNWNERCWRNMGSIGWKREKGQGSRPKQDMGDARKRHQPYFCCSCWWVNWKTRKRRDDKSGERLGIKVVDFK